MGRKRYYFPYVAKRNPMFHVAVTSKTLIERAGEVANVFEKYTKNSSPQSPRNILHQMIRQNESLLELSECVNTPETDSSSKAKFSPQSSSPDRRTQSVSGLKRKRLQFGDSTFSENLETVSHQPVFASPSKTDRCTFSKPTDQVHKSHDEPQEVTSMEADGLATAVKKLRSPIKEPEKDINPNADAQQFVSSAEMAKNPDSESPAKELKMPVMPIKDEKIVPKPAKRPKLCASLADIPEYVSPIKKAKARIISAEDDKMDTYISKEDQMSASPSKDCPAPGKEQVLTSDDEPQEVTSMEADGLATAVKKLTSPIKGPENDINPNAGAQQFVSSAEMAKNPDSESPAKEFKMPVMPIKDEKMVSKPAKRPKLCASLADIPEYVSPVKKAKTRIISVDDNKMDTYTSKDDQTSASPSENCPGQCESTPKMEPIVSWVPILKDDGIEFDISSMSEDTPDQACTVSPAKLEDLVDDPSRVESIRKAAEDRIKVSISMQNDRQFSPSGKNTFRSPRKSRLYSPDKDIKNTSCLDISPSILSNPNVMAYLKLRFKSVLSHRNKCMNKIFHFLKEFDGDMKFLYFYAKNVLLAVEDIPIEDEVELTRNLINLKISIIRNATELSNNLRSLINTLKSDIPFWSRCLKEIRKLNEKYQSLLSGESGSVTAKFLQEYESNLRIIWDKMDRKVLVEDGLRSSLLGISADYIKLTKNFAKYLIMVDIMKPSSLASSEGKKRKLRISWY